MAGDAKAQRRMLECCWQESRLEWMERASTDEMERLKNDQKQKGGGAVCLSQTACGGSQAIAMKAWPRPLRRSLVEGQPCT